MFNSGEKKTARTSEKHFGIIMAVYLLGLFVGGLYVGMVAPVRTVIQEQFGLGDATGIWMINIYTLFYAALIPVIGKLADRYGRKRVFCVCVAAFCVGAVMCGASSFAGAVAAPAVANRGGFALLLAGRVIQAIGACGMIPVANAEMGTAFPLEKRGMALGMAAATAGVANVLGSAAGSFVLAIVGNANWCMMFFLCVPLCVAIEIGALVFLENRTAPAATRLDFAGSVLLVLFVLLLLLSIREIDLFQLGASVVRLQCWLPLLGALVCLGLFWLAERRAEDPVFHVEYLRNRPIVITMAVSFFVGCVIITMTLVPEFAEVLTGARTGSGGYYVAVIGVFSLAGPIIAGKLIDKIGPKPVLLCGFAVMAAGFLMLAFVAVAYPHPAVLLAGLAIVGLGMGFSMGAPTNYMILEHTSEGESTAAVATIALVRQLGTSLAPAVYVGFIEHAAGGLAGYQDMMLAVVVSCAIAFVLMLFYRSPRAAV